MTDGIANGTRHPLNVTAGPAGGDLLELASSFTGPPGSRVHVLAGGDRHGPVVCLVHGNLSSSRFFDPLAAALPPSWHVLVPDLRGFGRSDPAPVDATKGVRDFADDIDRVLSDPALEPTGRRVHLVGWSMGGGVVMQYAIDHPDRVASVTLIAPLSPFGFGGTADVEGTLCNKDAAGTGAGTVAAELVRRLLDGDRTADSAFSPRSVLRSLYLRPPFLLSQALEDLFVDEILSAALGDDNYPGTQQSSDHWPGVAPGARGVANAMSPLYCNLSAFADVVAARPVLWVHGTDDLIVSDQSMLDIGHLGAIGAVPDWPGADAYPAQPMVSQTRAILRRGEERGGTVVESLFTECGHSPHLEHRDRFAQVFIPFVSAAEAQRR